jgi:hypothetical protein
MQRPELLRYAAERTARWRAEPIQMVREEFGVEPDPWQAEMLVAFADPSPEKSRIAMKACKGPGKTAGLAWAIWNFMACYGRPGEHPKGAATSITGDNLDDNLWPEIQKWRSRSKYFEAAFEWTKTRIFARHHPETWFFSARTWQKTADKQQQANTLSGIHGAYVLFVLDESGGIPDSVMSTGEAVFSTRQPGDFLKIVQAGNPTHLEGPLYAACTTARHLWVVIEITGDPDDPQRSPRIDIEWARQQIRDYGRENPWVMVNVLGTFPPASINALLGPDDCAAAMRRQIASDVYSGAPKVLGVDVAGEGDDRFVIFPRQGRVAFRPKIARNLKTQEQVAMVARASDVWGADGILVDATGGFGAGLIDGLQDAHYTVIPVHYAGSPYDTRYLNKRAEMYFEAQAWVKGGGCLPNMPELQRELCAITYLFRKDKFALQEKDQFKKLLGYSPDLADAFAETFAFPVMKKAPSASMAETFFDPRRVGRPDVHGPEQGFVEGVRLPLRGFNS